MINAETTTDDVEFQRWMAKYLPVEREIMAERDRREERRQKRLTDRRRASRRAYGDLCEVTEGKIAFWKEEGLKNPEFAFMIATDSSVRNAASRYFGIPEEKLPKMPLLSEILSGIILIHFILSLNIGAVVSCCALQILVRLSTMAVSNFKRRATRPLYYKEETARRRALAADRRRIVKRTTTNPCPTKEAILEAYLHRKDSKENAIRFGSLIHDLECYVDNSLRLSDGRITGRNEGIKGWLADNIPALVGKYTTIMRYKAAAKKLKQIVELPDPVPADIVLGPYDSAKEPPFEQTIRAVAVYQEIASGVKSATGMILKIDAYLDPDKVEESTTLAIWRKRYKNKITTRNRHRWWRRLAQS